MILCKRMAEMGALISIALLLLGAIFSAYAQDCEPKIIDSMDNTTDWNAFTDGNIGSAITLNSITGTKNFATEMAFDIKKDGWIGISKRIDPGVLSGTEGVQFTYKGTGVSNNLQLKLIDTDGTNFGVIWNGATAVDEWTTIKVPYSNFECLWCTEDKQLDLSKVEKFEFAVSNDGRPTGEGSVIIDEVLGLTCL